MKQKNPKGIGLKAAKNRAEKLERMAGVDKVKKPKKEVKKLVGEVYHVKNYKPKSELNELRKIYNELKRGERVQDDANSIEDVIESFLDGEDQPYTKNVIIADVKKKKDQTEFSIYTPVDLKPDGSSDYIEYKVKMQILKMGALGDAIAVDPLDYPSPNQPAKKEAKSKENFETMPESKEPAQEAKPEPAPQIPSKERLGDLLSQVNDLLKAKPELKNDPRIVALFGTENKPTVDAEKRNSKIMLTLNGKNQKENVTYRIVEAGDAIASHEPVGFSKREDYPEGVQERKYHSDKAEMMKVIRNAQQFDPAYLINTNPHATNGPPILTPEGIVLGGNSRVMSTQRVYANHPESAEAYKDFLKKQAETFGFSADEVSKFKAPLLVREYKPKTETKDHLAKLVRTLNESKTQGIDERQLGLATAVKIRDGRTLGALKTALKESSAGNVEGLMTKPSPALSRFKEALFADGVLTNENMNEMIRTQDGTLNGRGRDFIKSMLVGYVVRDSDLLEGLSTSSINHLSTAISKLASAGINEHTQKAMQDAIEIYHHAVSREKLKRGQSPAQRDAQMNDIMLSEQELFNTEAKSGETEDEKRQREQAARFAKTKERVSKDPLASSFLKVLTLSVGTRTLSEQMDKFLKLTEDTGVIDMFSGNSRISFDEAARRLSKDLAKEHGIEDQLYKLQKSLALLTLLKALDNHALIRR